MPTKSAHIAVIVGAQWGDEGKGKITDFFAHDSDFVVRFQGGDNAGHTVVVNDEVYKLHLIPSGVLYSHPISVIGNGVVINPKTLLKEIDYLEKRGIQPRLMVSDRAHVIMPYHIDLDVALTKHQGNLAAGSTKRGIAPVYADKMYRHGIRTIDLIEPKIFSEKLTTAYNFNKNLIEKVLGGKASHSWDEIFEMYLGYGEKLSGYLKDVSKILFDAYLNKESILFEGAQGISLDVDHGIYPHTTSSNTAAGHIAAGSGVGFRKIDRIIGIAKAYVTRVGISPFPTEVDGSNADELRTKGDEFGTTTGRPRRIGWLDLVQLRQAVRINGLSEIVLTKLDVLSGQKILPICTKYQIGGKFITEMPASLEEYRQAKPIYENLEGWEALDRGIADRGYSAFPGTVKNYIKFIEHHIKVPVTIVSIGPQRHETVQR
ncbi:adenylosuccinate synthase [Candidatus Neomarinimicrobiota bacterium]